MKIKIISDGTESGTKVMDAVTGDLVEDVLSVHWIHEVGGPPVAMIEVISPEADLNAEVEPEQETQEENENVKS